MKIKTVALALLLAVATPVFAAGVDGNWAGTITAPDGAVVEVKFSFKADGAKLTGTAAGPDGSATAIKNGKVEGNNIAFVVEVDMGGQALILNYTGVLAGDELKLHFEIAGLPIDLVAKKAP